MVVKKWDFFFAYMPDLCCCSLHPSCLAAASYGYCWCMLRMWLLESLTLIQFCKQQHILYLQYNVYSKPNFNVSWGRKCPTNVCDGRTNSVWQYQNIQSLKGYFHMRKHFSNENIYPSPYTYWITCTRFAPYKAVIFIFCLNSPRCRKTNTNCHQF